MTTIWKRRINALITVAVFFSAVAIITGGIVAAFWVLAEYGTSWMFAALLVGVPIFAYGWHIYSIEMRDAARGKACRWID